jgi:hypothetical protein
MKTIRLMGGLGNQLFQLAAGIYLRRRHDTLAQFDLSWFVEGRAAGDTRREFELAPLLRPTEMVTLDPRVARLAYSSRNPLLFTQTGTPHDVLGGVRRKHRWIQGYFQESRYPLAVRAELRAALLPHLSSLKPLAEADSAVGVHVRLGDYYSDDRTRSHHGVIGPEYFARALGSLPVPVHPKVLLFTDSPDIVEREYLSRMDVKAEVVHARSAWETMVDLSACQAIVMSNSSLSWWAAFVATALEGRHVPVVKPAPWFAQSSAADRLLEVDGWAELSRS